MKVGDKKDVWTRGVPTPECKVVFLGQFGVGKSSIARRMQSGQDETRDATPTIAAGYVSMVQKVPGPSGSSAKGATGDQGAQGDQGPDSIKLCMWDSSGSERFNQLLPMYVRGAHIVVLVYDVLRPESVDRLRRYYDEFYHGHNVPGLDRAHWLVVGNKADLTPYPGVIEQAEDLIIECGWSPSMDGGGNGTSENDVCGIARHHLVSARTGANLDGLLQAITKLGLQSCQDRHDVQDDDDVINLSKGGNGSWLQSLSGPCCN